jgi:hypothetical protein
MYNLLSMYGKGKRTLCDYFTLRSYLKTAEYNSQYNFICDYKSVVLPTESRATIARPISVPIKMFYVGG